MEIITLTSKDSPRGDSSALAKRGQPHALARGGEVRFTSFSLTGESCSGENGLFHAYLGLEIIQLGKMTVRDVEIKET